jgi:hypothetical protein
LGQIHLPHSAVSSHIEIAKLFDKNAKQFARHKKPLASPVHKGIL